LKSTICQKIEADTTGAFDAFVKNHFASVDNMVNEYVKNPQLIQKELFNELTKIRTSGVSNWIMDLFGPEGKRIENSCRSLMRDIEIIKFSFDNKENQQLDNRIIHLQKTYSEFYSTVEDYCKKKEKTAKYAAVIASSIVSSAIAVALAPTGGALIGAWMLAPILSGCTTRVGVKAAILNGGYDFKNAEFVKDIIKGGAVGSLSVASTVTVAALPLLIQTTVKQIEELGMLINSAIEEHIEKRIHSIRLAVESIFNALSFAELIPSPDLESILEPSGLEVPKSDIPDYDTGDYDQGDVPN
ncbi:hypothetical protein JYT19_00525, partial [Sulfobacillus acidophilus]|nr:hypothetical protein [Sulfobacillus acidophilus]